jgi:hypothetical protein
VAAPGRGRDRRWIARQRRRDGHATTAPADVGGCAEGRLAAHAEVLGRAPEGQGRQIVRLAGALVILLAAAGQAAAQAPEPPGPWTVDLRGTTAGLPSDTAFFPLITTDTLVPSRGFGLDLGAHVYAIGFGPSRLGVGLNYLRMRGTTEAVTTTLSTVVPQLSFNFGTRHGWSYLSAGLGRAWVRTTAEQLTGTATRESEGLNAVNFGGGARWFLTRHVGVGFDLRWHQISGPPRTTVMAAGVGFSVH